MPTLTQMEYLIAVDETKNFSRAAKKCNVSQPSLSSQIQKVEEELDIIVFDRSKKPIITTQKGKRLIEQSRKILRECKKIFDIKNDSGQLSGEFHLAVISSLASYVIPLFITSFSKKYPGVKLSISEQETQAILDCLYHDSIDAGLMVTPLYDNTIIERTLFYESFMVFASRGHELLKKKLIADADLDAHSVWLLEEGHCFHDQVIKVCSAGRRKNVLENIEFTSGSLETLVNLIRKGKGYTLLPELATIHLSEMEKQKNLRKFKAPIPTREVSLVYSRSFLKQDIVDVIEREILNKLPKSIRSLKREKISVIDI